MDALARWHGLALAPDATRALTAQAHAVTAVAVRLTEARHASPNAKGQDRLSRVMLGQIDLPPLPPDLRLVLALACRCHLGRHTNEGLGVIGLRPTA